MFIPAHWELDNQSTDGLSRPELITALGDRGADAAKQVSPGEADQLVDDAVAAPAELFLKRTRQWIGQHETAEFTDHEPVPASVLADLGAKAKVVGMVYNAKGQSSRGDAHYIHEYSAGGATNIDNLELDCHRDHALIHQHGFDPRRTSANPRAG